MTMLNDNLIEAIRARGEKRQGFGQGITTADRYVKSVSECIGSELCYRYAAARQKSFDDVMRKAAKTLVYRNEDMGLADDLLPMEVRPEWTGTMSKGLELAREVKDGEGLELPAKTLIVFRHVLTTPRKDRDGDILRTKGAQLDPKMLLLWQHVHTLPIGKMIGVTRHTDKTLEVVSCIVDMNELCHDAAVMVEAGMARFSHGFRAINFVQAKADEGDVTAPGGFDVKEFEIMEESVVSVPSNVDADTQEVLLSLVDGGKLTHPINKEIGRRIREKLPVRVAGFCPTGQGGGVDNTCGSGGGGKISVGPGKVSEETARGVVKQVHAALKSAKIPLYDESVGEYSDNKLGGLSKSSNTRNWELNDGDGGSSTVKKGQYAVGVSVQGKKLKLYNDNSDDDRMEVNTWKASEVGTKIQTVLKKSGMDVQSVRMSGYDAGYGTQNVDFEVIANKSKKSAAAWIKFTETLGDYTRTFTGQTIEELKAAFDAGLIGGKDADVDGSAGQAGGADCGCDSCQAGKQCPCASEETPAGAGKGQAAGQAQEPKGAAVTTDKAGRVLSQANYKRIKEVADDLGVMDDHIMDRPGKMMCKSCRAKLLEVLKDAGWEEEGKAHDPAPINMQRITSAIVANASREDIAKLYEVLGGLRQAHIESEEMEQYAALVGG